MTSVNDIQGNSWTDEPEIPNPTREKGKEGQPSSEAPTRREGPGSNVTPEGPASEQRPPSDS